MPGRGWYPPGPMPGGGPIMPGGGIMPGPGPKNIGGGGPIMPIGPPGGPIGPPGCIPGCPGCGAPCGIGALAPELPFSATALPIKLGSIDGYSVGGMPK